MLNIPIRELQIWLPCTFKPSEKSSAQKVSENMNTLTCMSLQWKNSALLSPFNDISKVMIQMLVDTQANVL